MATFVPDDRQGSLQVPYIAVYCWILSANDTRRRAAPQCIDLVFESGGWLYEKGNYHLTGLIYLTSCELLCCLFLARVLLRLARVSMCVLSV